MKRVDRWIIATCASFTLTFGARAINRTPLDEYVARPDPSFSFRPISKLERAGLTIHTLELTSQQWLTRKEVDRTEWKHWLLVFIPRQVTTTTALLFIGGGDNSPKPPSPDRRLIRLAESTGAIVAYLGQVPNQPLQFAGESKGRVEDWLIAYAWDRYLRTGNPEWAPRLPMTKAAVRAMDAVQEFCSKAEGHRVERFVVAGGSKRGWTTWTTAAVDKRVAAIIPMVIDVLNVERSMIHHWQAYGFWSPAIRPYEATGIMNWMGTREFARLMQFVDPYAYRERYTMPKFIVNSTGDQFFLPDSWQFYFDDLPGEKHLYYVPNTDHGLDRPEVADALIAYVWAIAHNKPRPRYQWSVGANRIRFRAIDPPTTVELWQATNPKARDFRLETIGAAWTGQAIEPVAGRTWQVELRAPAQGWTAYLVRATFPSGGPQPFVFTTGVKVVPDRLPFPPPKPEKPEGTPLRKSRR